ncbi:MAG: hypothetical protein FWC43_05655 [Planctomycetaceae bacterium]|nr:hypothetical protein [Planctomycetaceae bacterium]
MTTIDRETVMNSTDADPTEAEDAVVEVEFKKTKYVLYGTTPYFERQKELEAKPKPKCWKFIGRLFGCTVCAVAIVYGTAHFLGAIREIVESFEWVRQLFGI